MENLEDILRRLRASRPPMSESDFAAANGASGNGQARPEDYCPICEGRKWLSVDVPVGHPDFGKAVACQCQINVSESERETRLRRYSNLGPLSRMTFAAANPDGLGASPENARLFAAAFQASQEYADDPIGWLALTGPNGCGKTHLAAAIANRRIELGELAFFVHVPDLLDDLRSTYAPSSEISYSDLFEQVNDAELLILDGLGVQSPTPWAREKLHQIFNRRANAELPTVITTAEDVRDLDPYIASRLSYPRLSRVVRVFGRAEDSPSSLLGRIPENLLERMTFDSFDTRGNNSTAAQRASLQTAFDSAKAYAADPDGWLTMFGGTGVGKTHLAVAIASARRELGFPVFFAFVPELMDYLRYTFRPDSGVAYDSVFDQVRNAPLLILDDLNNERLTDWAYERLYQIVVHRHNSRMPTVITSPADITDMSGPISSRAQDSTTGALIRMEAPDYRIARRGGSRAAAPEHERRGRR